MKPSASTPVVFLALWLTVSVPATAAALLHWNAERDLGAALELQRDRVGLVEARAAELAADVDAIPPAATAAEVEQLEQRLGQCEARLVDVRHVLETLIRTEQHTGRQRWSLEELPRPISDWPDWPCRGEAIGSITERTHPCGPKRFGRDAWPVADEEAAAIRAVLSKQPTRRRR